MKLKRQRGYQTRRWRDTRSQRIVKDKNHKEESMSSKLWEDEDETHEIFIMNIQGRSLRR